MKQNYYRCKCYRLIVPNVLGAPPVPSLGSHSARNDVEIGRCPTGYQQNFTSKLCDGKYSFLDC